MNFKIAILAAALFATPIAANAQTQAQSLIKPPSKEILAGSTNALMLGGFCQGGSRDYYVVSFAQVMTNFWETENARLEKLTKKFRVTIGQSVRESERKLVAFISTKSPTEALSYCNVEHLKQVQDAATEYSFYINDLEKNAL